MKRAEVLNTAKDYVTQDRAAQHGDMKTTLKILKPCGIGGIALSLTIFRLVRTVP